MHYISIHQTLTYGKSISINNKIDKYNQIQSYPPLVGCLHFSSPWQPIVWAQGLVPPWEDDRERTSPHSAEARTCLTSVHNNKESINGKSSARMSQHVRNEWKNRNTKQNRTAMVLQKMWTHHEHMTLTIIIIQFYGINQNSIIIMK